MAPTGRKSKRTTTTTPRRRATTRTLDKQRRRKAQSTKQEATIIPCNSSTTTAASINDDHPSKLEGLDFDSTVVDDTMTTTSTSGCSTPKAQRFRIPEIHTCPPAPMKKRVLTNCRLRRPIAFFAPPDLEVFFLFALGDVSV